MSRASWRRVARAVLAVGGLALVAQLIRAAGPNRVARVLWEARALLPVVVALELGQLACDFLALRALLAERRAQLPTTTWVRSSATAYAMMVLLPAGRAAGEIARGALVAREVGVSIAAGAGAALQGSYVFANGLAATAACVAVASEFGVKSPLAAGLAITATGMFTFAAALIGLLRNARLAGWVRRSLGDILQRLNVEPTSPAGSPQGRIALPWRSTLACACSRALQVTQYAVILRAVGGAVTVRAAFVAHGIHLLGAVVGDLLPNQIGVVDGAYRAFAATIGFGDAPARALSVALVARAAQLLLAGACVVVATLTRPRRLPAAEGSASVRAGARS